MKFAIVGCEHAHIDIFVQQMLGLGHRLIGICDKDGVGLASALAEKYAAPLVREREKLLAEADVIGSSAVNREKIDLIESCERYGKPIMIDKPAVTNRADLARLAAVVARRKIAVGMLLTERFEAGEYTLKKWIERGTLGQIVSLGTRKPHRLNATARPEWFFDKAQCGGIMIDLLVHDFDLLRWLTGEEIVSVAGHMTKRLLPRYPGFYDSASVQAVTRGGVTAQFYADWYTPQGSWTWGDCRLFVTGTEGCAELRLNGDPFESGDGQLIVVTNGSSAVKVDLEQSPVNITEDFLRQVQGADSILTGHDIVAASKATIDADEQATVIRTDGNA